MSGNIDDDRFLQFIKLAQDLHILPLLGTDLYNKINDEIVAGTLSGVYLSLTTTYLKPILVHWATAEFLPFASYNVSNNGLGKLTSEQQETVAKEEVDSLSAKHRGFAQSYSKKFTDYMAFNYGSFPEWSTNTDADVNPNSNTGTFGGWVI